MHDRPLTGVRWLNAEVHAVRTGWTRTVQWLRFVELELDEDAAFAALQASWLGARAVA